MKKISLNLRGELQLDEENNVIGFTFQMPKAIEQNKVKKEKKVARSAATWEAYAAAYQRVYGILPLRDKQMNMTLSRFVDSLGEQEAPLFCKWYLSKNDNDVVARRHSIDYLWYNRERYFADFRGARKNLGNEL